MDYVNRWKENKWAKKYMDYQTKWAKGGSENRWSDPTQWYPDSEYYPNLMPKSISR